MRPCRRAHALAAAAIAGLAAGSQAATDCVLDTTVTASFGVYDGLQNDSATTRITGRCSNSPLPGTTPAIAPVISLSTGLSGTYASRQMARGASRLNYNLYTTAARTSVWGNGSGGTVTVPAYAAGSVRLSGRQTREFDHPNLTIHGRIPADQGVPAGVYVDTIVVTMTF